MKTEKFMPASGVGDRAASAISQKRRDRRQKTEDPENGKVWKNDCPHKR
jgi:hypothetical protein